jgi:two-component system chemotaxis response regulator CheB
MGLRGMGNVYGMAEPGVVVVGGSAGGVEALVELVRHLPADLPVPVLVTVHIGGNARSRLPDVVDRASALPARHAHHGEPLLPGHLYLAPPDFHLLAGGGRAQLSSGPRVNRHRPAVDVMFASAARWAGPRVLAVVLSGLLDDGAVGAALVARAGGRVIVQDPAEAPFDSMPRSTLVAVPDALTLPVAQAAMTVAKLAQGWWPSAIEDDTTGSVAGDGERGGSPEMVHASMADSDDPAYLTPDEARLTRLSCPDCSGGLAEIELTELRYYRCHVGHQYSPQSLEAAQREAAEAKLWAAAAALEEHAALARHLAVGSGTAAAHTYRQAADQSTDTARLMLARIRHMRPS